VLTFVLLDLRLSEESFEQSVITVQYQC